MKKLLLVAALGCGLGAAVTWMNRWGATATEVATAYPGDELIESPAAETTMAVTVAAEPERVWAWLVQIGQDRGGMYSYDRLEQLIGLEIHSAREINPQWQQLQPGDRIQLVPPGWGPLPDGFAFTVAVVDAPHTLVLRQGPVPWDGVWTFIVQPVGPGRSRLISRTRTRSDPGLTAAVKRAATSLGSAVTWFMTRKMLLTLMERAESPIR